jgi:predicted nucleic acid-binding protein
MKVVVADTSPINYLILIGCIDLLRDLYTRIAIPIPVWNELMAPGAPSRVAKWIRDQPAWVDIVGNQRINGPRRKR